VNKGEDTDDIIYRERILIRPGEKLEKVNQRSSLMAINLLSKMMNALEKGNVPGIMQSITTPTVRARKIKPDEYDELIK
jgi:methionyl-tRNA formyltransferase